MSDNVEARVSFCHETLRPASYIQILCSALPNTPKSRLLAKGVTELENCYSSSDEENGTNASLEVAVFEVERILLQYTRVVRYADVLQGSRALEGVLHQCIRADGSVLPERRR